MTGEEFEAAAAVSIVRGGGHQVPQPGRRVHSVEARGLAPLFGGNEEELAEEELAAWEKRM
jgi:hypothetical protein